MLVLLDADRVALAAGDLDRDDLLREAAAGHGAPGALLHRARELLKPSGSMLAEVEPPGAPTVTARVRLEAPGVVSDWFAWASVGVDGIEPLAAGAGFAAEDVLDVDGRWFARLRRT